MAESISEGTLKTWQKKVGDTVAADEEIATIETDKVSTAPPSQHHLFFLSPVFRCYSFCSPVTPEPQHVANMELSIYPHRSTCPSTRRRQARSPTCL